MANLTIVPPSPTNSLASPTLSALERWQPQNPAPATQAELSTAISALSKALEQAPKDAYAAAMVKLIRFAAAFQIPCPAPEDIQTIYRQELELLPADLLHEAMGKIQRTWTWGNRMPFPAEIRALVSEEWTRRRTLLSRAYAALNKAPESASRKNVIPAEKWDQLRKQIAAGRFGIPTSSGATAAEPELEDMTPEEIDARKREISKQCQTILDAG